MMYRMLIRGLAVAPLIALPAGNAIAQILGAPIEPLVIAFPETPEMVAAAQRKQAHHNDDGVAILKCAEDNSQPGFQPLVFTFSATFATPAACDSINDRCVDCLKVLTQQLDCEGNEEFTSNVVFEGTTTIGQQQFALNKFVFECDLNNNDDDDDDDDD